MCGPLSQTRSWPLQLLEVVGAEEGGPGGGEQKAQLVGEGLSYQLFPQLSLASALTLSY